MTAATATAALHAQAAQAAAAEGRSPHWPVVRRVWLHAHPECRACGGRADLEVHHLRPFHLFPDLELEPSNFVTLCGHCHLTHGHLRDFRAWNPECLADADRFRAKVARRPYTAAPGDPQ